MSEKSITVTYSASDVRKLRAEGHDDTSPDAPKAKDELPASLWKSAVLVSPDGKTSVQLPLDRDVFEWFRAGGNEHLQRMNAVLRSYMQEQGSKAR